MFTYTLISLPFLAAVLLLDLAILKTKIIFTKEFIITLTLMLILTAIFDQLLSGIPIVAYDHGKTLGINLWNMPIEDFLYTIVAVIGIGSLERYYGKRRS